MTSVPGVGDQATEEPARRGVVQAFAGVLRRRLVVVLTVLMGAVLAGILLVALSAPTYRSSAVLQVQTASAGSLQNVSFDLLYTDRLLNTYVELAQSDRVHDELVSRLEGGGPVALKAEVPANTELLVVEATAPDPQVAATAANTLAGMLADDIRENIGQRFDAARAALQLQLEGLDVRIAALRASPGGDPATIGDLLVERDGLVRSYNEALSLGAASIGGVSIVEQGDVPTTPTITPALLLGLAALFGSIGGFAVALGVDRLDRTVFDAGQAVLDWDLPVLGDMNVTAAPRPGLDGAEAATLQPQAVGVAFRLLQASPHSLVFTSAFSQPTTPGVVVDVSRALASTGLKVVVVDAARRPALHAALGTSDRPGFQEALRYGKPFAELALPTRHRNVHLVPGGSGKGVTPGAIEAFSGPDQLQSLTEAFDLIVVHAPPLLEGADASLLAKAVDGTVLVVQDGHLHDADLDEALEQATALPSAFLGVVVARPARRARRLSFRARRAR